MEGGGSGGVAENLGGGARYPPLSVATARQAVKTTLSRQNARALSFSDAASVRRLQRGWPGCTGFADQTVLYDAFFLAADSSGNVYVLDRTTAYTTCYTNICSNYAYNSVCSSCARLCRFAVTVPGVCASVSGYTPDGYEKGLSVDVAGNLYVYSYRDGAFQDGAFHDAVVSTLTCARAAMQRGLASFFAPRGAALSPEALEREAAVRARAAEREEEQQRRKLRARAMLLARSRLRCTACRRRGRRRRQ